MLKSVVNVFAVPYGAVAVSLTTTVLFTLYAVNIAFAMRKVTGNYMDAALGRNILKILLAGVCALCVYAVLRILLPEFVSDKFMFLIPLVLCGGVYCAVLLACGIVKTILKGRNADNPQ